MEHVILSHGLGMRHSSNRAVADPVKGGGGRFGGLSMHYAFTFQFPNISHLAPPPPKSQNPGPAPAGSIVASMLRVITAPFVCLYLGAIGCCLTTTGSLAT